jgi:hypothetical protein
METWYLLYDGHSEDGSGQGHYAQRTTDKTVARKHYEKCKKNPYSTGKVVIVTDTQLVGANPWTNWESIP